MDSSVTIIIRNENQQCADFIVKICKACTVAQLKSRIELEHPAKPKASSQRLIYDGKILKNENELTTIVKESNVVIQLIYKEAPNSQTVPKVASPSSVPEATVLRNRLHGQTSTTLHNVQGHQDYSQLYGAWMQQYQQHYNYYMQYYSEHGYPSANVYPATAPQNNVADEPADVPAVNEQEQRLQNFDAGLADEEGQDWLDALFALTRFFLMLSIVYFYSTAFKFVVAMIFLLGVHLYQGGFFRVRRNPVQPQQNADNPQNPQDEAGPDDNNNTEANTDNEEEVPAPPSLFATAVCFIRSFFSSLIPTGPPGVVN